MLSPLAGTFVAEPSATELPMATYVVAVKLSSRTSIPEDWIERIGHIDGVQDVVRRANPHQITVHATDVAIARLKAALGDHVYVERAAAYGIAG
jgi:hypothetical protein